METYFLIFLCLLISGSCLKIFQDEYRQSMFYKSLQVHHVFYCHDCRIAYGSQSTDESAQCPICGEKNDYLRF